MCESANASCHALRCLDGRWPKHQRVFSAKTSHPPTHSHVSDALGQGLQQLSRCDVPFLTRCWLLVSVSLCRCPLSDPRLDRLWRLWYPGWPRRPGDRHLRCKQAARYRCWVLGEDKARGARPVDSLPCQDIMRSALGCVWAQPCISIPSCMSTC